MFATLISCLCLGQGLANPASTFDEMQIEGWRPSAATQPLDLVKDPAGIEGLWLESDGWCSVRLLILQIDKDLYSVEVESGGCTPTPGYKRTATFRNGVLRLNRAVSMQSRGTTDRFYFAARNGATGLLPGHQEGPYSAQLIGRLPSSHIVRKAFLQG